MIVTRICVLIMLATVINGSEILFEKRKFCGDTVRQTLQQFCYAYYTPDADYRAKREAITECCKNSCSTYYFLTNYCQSFDKEEVIRYMEEERRQKLIRRLQDMESKRNRRRRKVR